MKNPVSNLPLYVDLDGTLIKSDLMFESVLILLKQNPFLIIAVFFWLLRSSAYLKAELAKRVEVSIANLPVNEELLLFLKEEKKEVEN